MIYCMHARHQRRRPWTSEAATEAAGSAGAVKDNARFIAVVGAIARGVP